MIMRIDWPIGLVGRIAKHAFRRQIPGGDDAVEILADDRIVRRFHDPREVAQVDVSGQVRHELKGPSTEEPVRHDTFIATPPDRA